jgi:hypothetical protein
VSHDRDENHEESSTPYLKRLIKGGSDRCPKWELVMVSYSETLYVLKLEPAGKINLQTIIQKHPKAKVKPDKDSDADTLDFSSHAKVHALTTHYLSGFARKDGNPLRYAPSVKYL